MITTIDHYKGVFDSSTSFKRIYPEIEGHLSSADGGVYGLCELLRIRTPSNAEVENVCINGELGVRKNMLIIDSFSDPIYESCKNCHVMRRKEIN